MSLATRLAPRRSRPRLKVISPSLTTPRHAQGWHIAARGSGDVAQRFTIEMWTESEWARLHPAERPDGAVLFPGFGFVEFHANVSREDFDAACEAAEEEVARYRALRGMEG